MVCCCCIVGSAQVVILFPFAYSIALPSCLLRPCLCCCLPPQMHRIVVSRQSPDALLGLPGVLCIIGASREKGHEKADIPVHVFGPEGTTEFLSTMYDVSGASGWPAGA